MCGFSGTIGNNINPVKDVLRHRGPDSHGYWAGNVAGKPVHFVHNRLSILDLSLSGHQPMADESGNFVLIFNGEIYNYRELQKEHFPGHPWKGHSDTELLLQMLIRYKSKAIPYLNGDFAFAFLDQKEGNILLARDRFGIKPLYYSLGNDKLVFGSEIKALQDVGIELEMDQGQLAPYLTFKFIPGNDTLYKGIHRLPPANYLEYDIGSHEYVMEEYWNLNNIEACKENYHVAAEKLKALIDDAIRMRLISDVPVGAFLSGGLDSSIIASAIKDRDDVTFYLAGKKEEDLKKEGSTSDAYYARLLAREWNLNLEELPIGVEELNMDMLEKIIHFSDDLIADGSQVPAWLISQAASKRSKVLLSGMGADEVFYGYNWHQLARLDQWMHSMPRLLSNPVAAKMASLNQGKGRFLAYRRYLHKLGKYFPLPAYRYGLYALVGDAGNAWSLIPEGKEQVLKLIQRHFASVEDPLNNIFNFDLQHFLVKNLAYTDRMAMAHSIEVRVPFLDHRVVEYAASMPSHWKLGKLGQPKRILKSAYKDVVPSPILKRRKAGFGMPLRSIFSEEKNVRELLDESRLQQFTALDAGQVEQLLQSHIQGREDNSALIFALIMLSIASP